MAKTVLITGAAVRIGREIALCLADAGYDIAIHYNRSKTQALALASAIRKKGRKVYLVQADLRKSKDVEKILPTLTKQGAKLDCLINNAAMFEKDNLSAITPGSWQSHIATNLFAPILLMRDFASRYRGDAGNIINITDGLAGWSISPSFLSYSLSKMGLENATWLLASEVVTGIRVNAVALGPTLKGSQDDEKTFAKLEKLMLMKRTTSIKEVCDTVGYILSTPSLTGQVITLSGGLS